MDGVRETRAVRRPAEAHVLLHARTVSLARAFESDTLRFALFQAGCAYPATTRRTPPLYSRRKEASMSILWIILIVVLVLALLGFLGFR